MTAKLDYVWKLREVMATRGMFQTTDLRSKLVERRINLSLSQVYRLVVDKPETLNLTVLMALLDDLDCRMNDLIRPIAAIGRGRKAVGDGAEAPVSGVGQFRPKRARIDPGSWS